MLVAGTVMVQAQTGVFTVQVGLAASPPVTLVDHADDWRYRKGTSAPPLDWQTVPDTGLDASWLTGPGGLGYADNDDATILTDMRGSYVSVHARQSFTIPDPIDPAARLHLIIDYDDGFIAYLNGTEVARSANVPGIPGQPHPYNQDLADEAHEADGAEVFDLGPASLLGPGTHVLAIQIINDDIDSSDLTLIADLAMVRQDSGTSLASGLFALITGESLSLSGTNTIPGSTRVAVNGEEASFNVAGGEWSQTLTLVPGMNRLFITALDADGRVLDLIRQDVVYQQDVQSFGGPVTSDVTWTSAGGIVRLTNHVMVEAGATLAIEEGVVVLFAPGVSMHARTNGTIEAVGTAERPVHLLPANGNTPWGNLATQGNNARIDLRHTDMAAGQLSILTGGRIEIEDSTIRELYERQMIECLLGQQLTLRRCHIYNYAQAHIDYTPTLVEDCLIENITSDAMDFAGLPAEIIVRRTTWRNGEGGNTDAIDLSANDGLLVEDCLIHGFPDKGVSIAQFSHNTTVRNSLIYNCGMAISVYSSSNCVISQNTVVGSTFGLRLWERDAGQGAGHAVGENNILWNNAASLQITNGATFQASYSLIEIDPIVPGPGNLNEDPMFVDAANHDYRLASGSPAMGTGAGGVDMGVIYPVGGLPPAPLALSAIPISQSEIRLEWDEDADNETEFEIEHSTNGVDWSLLATIPYDTRDYLDSGRAAEETVYYRVRAVNGSGTSPYSNPAKAQSLAAPVAETIVGGTLVGNTSWTTNMGRILVNSDVIVPTGVTLTIHEGSQVEMAAGRSISTQQGGHILIAGTESAKVFIQRQQPGSDWTEVAATGAGSSLTVLHADISGGETRFLGGSTGLMEDCNVHDFSPTGSTIIYSLDAVSVTMRRCRVAYYHETLFQRTLMLIEDCLFEYPINPSSDAIDFDGPPLGSVMRRCTFRYGLQDNTDAVDIGPSGGQQVGVIIEDCLMHDFTDKGVSIGEIGQDNSLAIVVRNCLIYDVGIGVQVKDTTEATVYDCTIVNAGIGLHGFEKTASSGGGRLIDTFNNIMASCDAAVGTEDDTFIQISYSNTQGTNWPGVGNINIDPLFLDAAEYDFRLQALSPSLGSGLGGTDMGVTFPVGGLPRPPESLSALPMGESQAQLSWEDPDDVESGFVIEVSVNGSSWMAWQEAPRNATQSIVNGLTPGETYSFRVRGTNFIGASYYSNSAPLAGDPDDLDGDGIPNDWETDHGYSANDPTDAAEDSDGDGMTTLEEYLAGTDPRDAGSRLAFDTITLSAGNVVQLQFMAQAGKAYAIQFRDSMDSGSWNDLVTVPTDTVTRVFSTTDFLLPNLKSRFYRIELR